MPIKPENKHKYPANWASEIRPRILARAENRCENPECRVHNGAVGYREKDGRFVMLGRSVDEAGLKCDNAELDGHKVIRIVLTIAHLDHDETNSADENLAALCQRCHLRHDQQQHTTNSYMTRMKKRNNGELFNETR